MRQQVLWWERSEIAVAQRKMTFVAGASKAAFLMPTLNRVKNGQNRQDEQQQKRKEHSYALSGSLRRGKKEKSPRLGGSGGD